MRISSVFFAFYISFASAEEGSLIRGELKDKSVVGKQVGVDNIVDTSCVLRGTNPKDCLGKKDMNGDPCYVCGNKYVSLGVCVNGDQKKVFDSTVNKLGMSNYLECDSDDWNPPDEEDKNNLPNFLKQISVLTEGNEPKSDFDPSLVDPICVMHGFYPNHCIGQEAAFEGNCFFCGNKFLNAGLCATGAQKNILLGLVDKAGLSDFIGCDDQSWTPGEGKKHIEDDANTA